MAEPGQLVVIWSSGDREVAFSMVFMYTKNSKLKGWWDQVRLVVWGPAAKLLANDLGLREELKQVQDAEVELLACKACSDMYGVSDQLTELGINVKYMGQPLTDMLKDGWRCITF
jgi:hypothetical protein